jgi:hypothetical protein
LTSFHIAEVITGNERSFLGGEGSAEREGEEGEGGEFVHGDGSNGERRKENGEWRMDGAIGVTPFHSPFSILQFEFILLAF